ncbi:MAG: GAF domain-containing protein [Planctomycetota bacterium]
MQVATKNLVYAVEVWRPNDAGDCLTWSWGACGDRSAIEEGRCSRQYGHGEGLIGRAWSQRSPAIAYGTKGSLAEEFGTDGVKHAIAIPAIKGDACRGVVVFLCDNSDDQQGAFELWPPNDRGELSLDQAWHPNLERFGLISQHVKFPRRAGLPGKVWNDRFPRVMGALGTSKDFVRVAGAKADGLSTAIGIPFMKSAMDLEAVLLLLSAAKSPIARVAEVWAADPETDELKIISADFGSHIDLAPLSQRLRLAVGEGLAGRVFQDEAPWLTRDLLGVEFPRGEQFAAYGFDWGLGLPVFVGDRLIAAVTLFN